MQFFFILTVMLLLSPAPGAKAAAGAPAAGASAIIDFAETAGALSPYLSGTTEGPFYSRDSYPLLKEGGFPVVQVVLWLSGPEGGGPRPRGGMQERSRLKDRAAGSGGTLFDRNLQTAKSQVRSLLAAGAQPLVFMTQHDMPPDPATFQELVKRTVTELRSVAREEGKDLLLFRFGNEPDSKRFWTGTRQQYFETYRHWAQAVKSVSPDFIVEAPALASATGRYFNDEYYETVNDFTKEFLAYCRANQVPLDVFSFHYYGVSIMNLRKELDAVRRELNSYQDLSPVFGKPRIGVDEWNIRVFGLESNRYQSIFDTAHTAAHNVAALIAMAKSDVWLSIRFGGLNYRRSEEGGETRFGGRPGPVADFLMVDSDGRPKPVFYGFKAFNRLRETPRLVGIRQEQGMHALAGRSEDSRSMNIVVSFYDPGLARQAADGNRTDLVKPGSGDGVIRVKNLPWGAMKNGGSLEISMADDSRNLTPVERKSLAAMKEGEDLVVRLRTVIPSVACIHLHW
jgi:hypothetical protein